MEMFNKKAIEERIGDMPKSETLYHLKDCEKHFVKLCGRYGIEYAYDVVANELPYFKTIQYTEWAHCFTMNPLQQWLRTEQLQDAFDDECEVKDDWLGYFRDRITRRESNKYAHINTKKEVEPRPNLVVLVGSNQIKERICGNKLQWIEQKHGDDVWFKPHPLTTHQIIGELKDMLGEDKVLDREDDMYALLMQSDKVYSSHLTESAMYAVALGKEIEPTDVYNLVERGSFYHINKYLFTKPDPALWMNKALNSPKSGIINPILEEDWKQKMDQYFEYIFDKRATYKYKYVYDTDI